MKTKAFKFTEVFDYDRGKRFTEKEQIPGDVAYISSTKENNGISNFVTPVEKNLKGSKIVVYNNCLTLSNSGSVGYLFYHDYDFIASDHVTVIWLKDKSVQLNKYIALFLKPIFESIRYKYNFGREISNRNLEKELIELPAVQISVDKNSKPIFKPDWKYMENHIKKLEENIKFKNIVSRNKKIIPIDFAKWKEFKVKDYFDVIGSTTTKLETLIDEYGVGKYPYVTTQATNNGVAGYYDCYTEEGNVLVADSAVVGHVSYQQDRFSASDHVEKLVPNFYMNKYIAMFLVTMLNCENYRYSYGRKFNQGNIRNTVVKLPAKQKENGEYEPDWQYMENYIKLLPYADLI